MTAQVRGPAFPLPVGPNDLVRHVLAAYYRAVGDATAPIGDPEPADWSDPETFLDTLLDYFQLRVRVEAAESGQIEVSESERERWRTWSSHRPYRDQHVSEVWPEDYGAGVQAEPADKAHGCAALVPAVGPAPADLGEASNGAGQHGQAQPLAADPLFSGPARQDLPPPGTIHHAHSQQGSQSHG